MPTAQDIYTAAQALSLPERLRLAALLLEGLNQSSLPQSDLAGLDGYSDAWSEEDIDDLRRFSARRLLIKDSSQTEQDDALPPWENLLKMKMEQSLEPEHI